VRDVWHQCHEAGALDCASEVTLLLGIKASTLATVHASVRVHVVTETNDVLVVNVLELGLLVNIVLFCLFHNCYLVW
jgi:hypothetical protein